jgi:hypothetical protein
MSNSSLHGSLPVGGAIVIARKKKRQEIDGHAHTGPAGSTLLRRPTNGLLASRRASTGTPSSTRFAGSLNSRIIDEKLELPGSRKGRDDVLKGKDGWIYQQRRTSDDRTLSMAPSNGKRLGIRRSIDLTGEPIERYSSSNHSRLTSQPKKNHCLSERRSSLGAMSTFSLEDGVHSNDCYNDYDEPDELKASVVAELILRVADVGHFFQRYDIMVHGTSRTFLELLQAHKSGRGIDPRPSWFDNQVRIMEGYVLPLASQLEVTGVLSRALLHHASHGRCVDVPEGRRGSAVSLIRNIETNHGRWMRQGFEVVASLIQETAS